MDVSNKDDRPGPAWAAVLPSVQTIAEASNPNEVSTTDDLTPTLGAWVAHLEGLHVVPPIQADTDGGD